MMDELSQGILNVLGMPDELVLEIAVPVFIGKVTSGTAVATELYCSFYDGESFYEKVLKMNL